MSSRPAIFTDRDTTYKSATDFNLGTSLSKGKVEDYDFSVQTYQGPSIPELKTAGFWDARRPQDWGIDWHRNEGIEISYLSKGSLDFSIANHSQQLVAGQLALTRPWQRHRLGTPHIKASRWHWLILDVDVRKPNDQWVWPDWLILNNDSLNDLTRLIQLNTSPVMEGNKSIESCFERLASAITHTSPKYAETHVKIAINELLLLLVEALHQSQKPNDITLTPSRDTVQYFLDELPQHLGYPWSVDQMAAECGLARSRFSHYCKQITNTTPLEHLNRLRLNLATQLLSQTDSTISQIAPQCGFQSTHYFATWFRKHTDKSPSQSRS